MRPVVSERNACIHGALGEKKWASTEMPEIVRFGSTRCASAHPTNKSLSQGGNMLFTGNFREPQVGAAYRDGLVIPAAGVAGASRSFLAVRLRMAVHLRLDAAGADGRPVVCG